MSLGSAGNYSSLTNGGGAFNLASIHRFGDTQNQFTAARVNGSKPNGLRNLRVGIRRRCFTQHSIRGHGVNECPNRRINLLLGKGAEIAVDGGRAGSRFISKAKGNKLILSQHGFFLSRHRHRQRYGQNNGYQSGAHS